jgi:ABC-type glycerol-3-phosphate transport system substrate-binding protein
VIDDTVWAVPDLASARALFYNVDMFEEVGIEVPTTWSELEDACQAIVDYYEGEVYPCGIDMTTDEGQAAFAYYTWGNGGAIIQSLVKVYFDDGDVVIQFAVLSTMPEGVTEFNDMIKTLGIKY